MFVRHLTRNISIVTPGAIVALPTLTKQISIMPALSFTLYDDMLNSLLLKPDIVRFRVKKGAGKPKFSDIFCGPYHTFAATQRGEVYVWGLNNYGQLCTGDSKNRYQPEGGLIGGRGLGRISKWWSSHCCVL